MKRKIILFPPSKEYNCRDFIANEEVEIDGTPMTCIKGAGDWFGFYDWLRSKDGEILGLRIKFDTLSLTERQQLALTSFLGEVMVTGKTYILPFGDLSEVIESISGDADFGGNLLYTSKDGQVVGLTFNYPQFAKIQ